MAFLENILKKIKQNTLDRTNVDEKIGGFIKNTFNSAKNSINNRNQMVSPLSSKVENSINWNEPAQPKVPSFKTEAASKVRSRLEDVKRFGIQGAQTIKDTASDVGNDIVNSNSFKTAMVVPRTAIKIGKDSAWKLGTSLTGAWKANKDADNLQKQVLSQKEINDLNLKKVKALNEAGDREGAARLLAATVKQNDASYKDIVGKSDELISRGKQGMKDALSGGIKTAETVLTAGVAPAKILINSILGGTIGAVAGKATGEDPYDSAVNGAANAFTSTGILDKFTNPVTEKLLGASKSKNFLLNQLTQRGVGAGTNTIEDNIINLLDTGKFQDKNQNVTSAAIGAILSGNDQISPTIKKLTDKYVFGKEAEIPNAAQKFSRDTFGRFAKAYNNSIDNLTAVGGGKLSSGEFVPKADGSGMIRKDFLNKQNGQTMMGATAGMETYQDENGETKMRFNPDKAAMGMAVMGGVQTKAGKDILQNLKIKNIDDILGGKKQQLEQMFESAKGNAQVAAEMRNGIDENLIKLSQRLSNTKAYTNGDVENLLANPKYSTQISDAIEQVRTKLNDPNMSAGDAFEYLSKLPKKSDMTVKFPEEYKGLKKEVGELENGVQVNRDAEGNIIGASAQSKKTVDDIFDEKIKAGTDQFNKEQKSVDRDLFSGYKTKKQMEAKAKTTIASGIRKGSSDGLPTPNPISPKDKKGTIIGKIKNSTDYLLRSGKSILNGMGANGQEAAKRLENFRTNHAIWAGTDIDSYNQAVKGMGDDSIEKINRFLDGQDVKLDANESAAATKVRGILDSIAKKSQQVGIKIKDANTGERSLFRKMENYLPHNIDVDKLAANRDLTINALTKQFGGDAQKATNFVDEIINGQDIPSVYKKYFGSKLPSRFGNLEMSRVLDLPSDVLKYDKSLLPEYFNSANERIAQSKEFGADNELITKLIENIETESGKGKMADDIISQALNLNKKNVGDDIAGTIKQVQAATKMGTSFISNAGQSVNTATKGGVKNTVSSAVSYLTGGKQVRENMKRAAVQAGNTTEQALKEIREGYGNENKVLTKITAPFFNKVEEFNRILSTDVGKKFTQQNYQKLLVNSNNKAARRALESIGLNPDELLKTGITDDILKQSAYKFDKATQFSVVGENVPPAWNTPVGRVVTQFKTFAYKQAGFIKKEVFDEARKGNVAPLARYVLLGTVVGEVINDAKAIATNKERKDQSLGGRMFDNITAIGGAGLTQDAIKAFIGGDYTTTRFLAGPTGSDVLDASKATSDLLSGKPKNAAKFVTQRIPIVGRTLSNTIFPSQSTSGMSKKDINGILSKSSGSEKGGSVFDTKLPTSDTGRAQVDTQLADIKKAKDKILEGGGINIFGKQVGGMSDEEKNAKLAELDTQEAYLKNLKTFDAIKKYQKEGNKTTEGRKAELEAYKGIAKIYDDEELSDAAKENLIKQSGLDREEVDYYLEARESSETKAMNQAELAGTMTHAEWINSLTQDRIPVGGKQKADNSTLDALYEGGYLSDAERDYLKAIKYDPTTGKMITDRDYKGGSGSTKDKNAMEKALKDLKEFEAKNSKKSINSLLTSSTSKTGGSTTSRPATKGSVFEAMMTPSMETNQKNITQILGNNSKVKRKYYKNGV